tara:strand:+ start:5538 stop:8756 length:3219 start_codon:yes stop_codon:yes gene_type:complete
MNAFEFINKALEIKNNELDAIIRLANDSEVDWLEFKAAIQAESSLTDTEYNDADYTFNLVKALISMANGAGGLVVLGVNDDGDAIGLHASGYDGNRETFTRDLSQRVFLREGWRTKSSGHWRWKTNSDQLFFEPKWAKYQGMDVIVFPVASRKESHGPLLLTHATSKSADPEDVFFVRAGGDRGITTRISAEQTADWWTNRDTSIVDSKFSRWIKELQKTEPGLLQFTVSTYCKSMVDEGAAEDRLYVSLEADARTRTSGKSKRAYETDNSYLSENLSESNVTPHRGPCLDLITKLFPVFLLGEPGAGKSTSLLKLARDINLANPKEPDCWALYVSLSGFTADGLRELICREIPPLNWMDVQLGLETGQLTLVLDGLNECPSTHYLQCATEISDLFKSFSGSKIVVSTRLSHLPAFARNTIEIRSLGLLQQQQFISKHLQDNVESVSAFEAALARKPTAHIIAKSPILLRLAAWIWANLGELPGGLAELYGCFFDAWLRREIARDLDAGEIAIWSEEETRDALSLLAYSMRSDGVISCSRGYAEKCLQPALGDKTKKFLDRTVQGLMIQVDRNGSMIRFRHETIQEYLVAVFLTSHSQHQLVHSEGHFDSRRWSMPIVFAFELFDEPPEHFLHVAWEIAPLLVCSSFRDDDRLLLLPEPIGRHFSPQNDLWVRGIIRCMRGESVEEITNKLSHLGRTPSPGRYFQKHPLPEELISALEGVAFWYALNSHDQGKVRIERLQHLLIDRRNLWLELLPHAITGQPGWITHLTSSQKLLVGELNPDARIDAIESASVVELCYMVRNRIITEEEFRKNWKRALNVDSTDPVELEVLALMGSKKIKASQLNGSQRAVLRQIGENIQLSPRIVHVLVRDGVLQAVELRKNQERISYLAETVSPVRALQLIRDGVLKASDFSRQQLHGVFERVKTEKDISFILESGLVKSRQGIPKSVIDRAHGRGEKQQQKIEKVASSLSLTIDTRADKPPAEIISEIYLSPEQITINRVEREVKDPNNFSAGHGYHRVLEAQVEASRDWPVPERDRLLDLAEVFFRAYGSKKRQKQYRDLVRSIRDSK